MAAGAQNGVTDVLRDVDMNKLPKIPITLTGGAAKRALATDCRGRVLAVFRRSFYLESFSGALACLGPSSIEPGPLVARCEIPDAVDWARIGLRTDARVRIEKELLTVDGRHLFDMRGAREWAPPGFPSKRGFLNLPRGIAALRKKALEDRSGGGFGFLIPLLLGQSSKSVKKKKTTILLRTMRGSESAGCAPGWKPSCHGTARRPTLRQKWKSFWGWASV